jgi:hypothetical protein
MARVLFSIQCSSHVIFLCDDYPSVYRIITVTVLPGTSSTSTLVPKCIRVTYPGISLLSTPVCVFSLSAVMSVITVTVLVLLVLILKYGTVSTSTNTSTSSDAVKKRFFFFL